MSTLRRYCRSGGQSTLTDPGSESGHPGRERRVKLLLGVSIRFSSADRRIYEGKLSWEILNWLQYRSVQRLGCQFEFWSRIGLVLIRRVWIAVRVPEYPFLADQRVGIDLLGLEIMV